MTAINRIATALERIADAQERLAPTRWQDAGLVRISDPDLLEARIAELVGFPAVNDFWPAMGTDPVVDELLRHFSYPLPSEPPKKALDVVNALRELGYRLGEIGEVPGDLEGLDLQDSGSHGRAELLDRNASQFGSGMAGQVPDGVAEPTSSAQRHESSPSAGSGTGSVGEAGLTSLSTQRGEVLRTRDECATSLDPLEAEVRIQRSTA